MKLLTVLLTLTSTLLVEGQVSMHNPFYCYTSDPIRPQYAMHAKQSNYEAILRRGFNPNVSTCTPTGFWYLSRHGGCLPKVGTIEDMNNIGIGPIQANIMRNFHSGRATLCHTDFHQIRDWKPDPNITLDNAGALTGPGRILTHSLAQRYQEAFPTVLRRPYNRAQFTFRHTDRARSESTARVFADGLFGSNANENVEFENVPQVDTFLRPNSFCPNFTSLFSNVETEAFMDGPEFRETVSQVNSKLGFTGSDQLSVQKLLTLWDVCRYEKSFEDEGRTSAWCGAFSIANNEVLEYLQDLRYYYMFGYGVPNRRIVENLNCGLMQNLLNFLSSDEATSEAARVFVTSSSNLEAFFVSLGLFEDEQHLTRHNMAKQMNRKWRTSWMAPKGANLAVIRYDCAEDDNDVLFLFNERPLQIPGCQANGLCKDSFIMDRFSRFIGTDCSNIFCTSN